MRYNVYCDEASIHGGVRYMLIGGLWVPWDIEPSVRDTISGVRDQHHLRAEMKWTKVSRTMLPAYQDFVDALFDNDRLSFKCIVLDTLTINPATFKVSIWQWQPNS
jgi:hypothetical protein